MCGILGGNNLKWDYKAGMTSMLHRGPDGQKISHYRDFTLAFTRLSIMDLSQRAMQPMDSEDKKVHIVFNGEIYGFNKLKRALRKKHEFKTTSDTEVILNAYLEFGDKFIEYIDGMFGIAIYDEREGKVKLYRDRAGIKPLYYFFDGKNFAFSSELKGIMELCRNVRFEIDYTAIYDYLMYQYIPEPKSMFKNVYKLQPANALIFDIRSNKIIQNERYWKLHVNIASGRVHSKEDVHEHLRFLVRESIKDQLVADVPVGTFLSGGIDSSIVTYEASRLKEDIEAFSIGFLDEDYDESPYAKILTDKYDLNVETNMLGKNEIQNVKGHLKQWYDEPFADTSAYPTFMVSRFAKNKVTVVLTGDGGDELFGGYTRYSIFLNQRNNYRNNYFKLYDLLQRLGKQVGIEEAKIYEMFETELDFYASLMGVQYNAAVETLAKGWKIGKDYDSKWHLKRYYVKELPPLTRVRYLDFKTYLPGDILTKVDRASMQVSLESRVPFLSKKIIEFAFSLSEEECCPGNELKGCLKEAYSGIIPNEILYRPKKGFGVPADYLRKERNSGSTYFGILQREWPDIYYISKGK